MSAGWMRWTRPSTVIGRRSSSSQSWTAISPAEVARPIPSEELLEILASGPAAQPARDEDGEALAWDAVPLELVEHCGERITPGIVLGRGQRQRRRLYDDRRSSSVRRDRLERRSGKRVPERLGDRPTDIRQRVERRRRGEQESVVGQGDERQPRARMEGDAAHADHLHARRARRVGASGDGAKQAIEGRAEPETREARRGEAVARRPTTAVTSEAPWRARSAGSRRGRRPVPRTSGRGRLDQPLCPMAGCEKRCRILDVLVGEGDDLGGRACHGREVRGSNPSVGGRARWVTLGWCRRR